MTLVSHILARWRALDPPWYVILLVLFAVLVLPGGIPLTLLALGIASRRSARRRDQRVGIAGA